MSEKDKDSVKKESVEAPTFSDKYSNLTKVEKKWIQKQRSKQRDSD